LGGEEVSESRAQVHADHGGAPACTACESREVRASRSSYPHDLQILAGGPGDFWRCLNCGARFPGPRAPERKRRVHGHGGTRSHRDPLAQAIEFGRATKRWIFPVLAILVTIVTIVYILDRRAPPQERFTLPGL